MLFAVLQTCRVLQSARYGGPPRIETGTGYSCDLEDAGHMLPAAMGDCLLDAAHGDGDLCRMRTIPWSLERGRSSVDASAGVLCRGRKRKVMIGGGGRDERLNIGRCSDGGERRSRLGLLGGGPSKGSFWGGSHSE